MKENGKKFKTRRKNASTELFLNFDECHTAFFHISVIFFVKVAVTEKVRVFTPKCSSQGDFGSCNANAKKWSGTYRFEQN